MDDEARLAEDLKKLEKEQQRKRKELELLAKQKREDAAKAASRHALFLFLFLRSWCLLLFSFGVFFSVPFVQQCPRRWIAKSSSASSWAWRWTNWSRNAPKPWRRSSRRRSLWMTSSRIWLQGQSFFLSQSFIKVLSKLGSNFDCKLKLSFSSVHFICKVWNKVFKSQSFALPFSQKSLVVLTCQVESVNLFLQVFPNKVFSVSARTKKHSLQDVSRGGLRFGLETHVGSDLGPWDL